MIEAFKTIEIEELAKYMAEDNYHVLKISKNFPLDPVISRFNEIKQNYELIVKDNYKEYKAIGLQYEDENNSLYDVVNTISYITEKHGRKELRKLGGNYLKKNQLGEKFMDFFDYFEQVVYLIRGRILTAEPGCQIREHTDGICCSALHYVLETDKEAKIIIEDKEYHLPCDGYFYVINASRRHYIRNSSIRNRSHIVFPINPACFRELTKTQMANMKYYFEQMNLDLGRFKHLKIID